MKLLAVLSLGLLLSSCGVSVKEKCLAAHGKYHKDFKGFVPVIVNNGKLTMVNMIPQYEERCDK